MNFGKALEELKRGENVARTGWNGKGMWLQLCNNNAFFGAISQRYDSLPFIVMKTADNYLVPWLASQTDILAEDWEVIQ